MASSHALEPEFFRNLLELSHRLFTAIDTSPLVTITAVRGVCFGGGLEAALTCDLIIADQMARFCCAWG